MYNSRQTCQVLKEEALFIPSWATSGRTRHFICILKTGEGFSSQAVGRAEAADTKNIATEAGAGRPGGLRGRQAACWAGREPGRPGKAGWGAARLACDSHHCSMQSVCAHTCTLTPAHTNVHVQTRNAHTCTLIHMHAHTTISPIHALSFKHTYTFGYTHPLITMHTPTCRSTLTHMHVFNTLPLTYTCSC